jgi:ubiquinone/menaquinone biosynthesis C-methylase UbiE
MTMDMGDQLTPSSIYELVAEVGFKKYFHLGGLSATRELIGLCPIRESSYVLDVGCASGKTACYLARRFRCQVLGVDILPGMVELANERASAEGVAERVDFKVGDAQELPLSDDLFDVVIGEFITGLVNDKERAVREYVRVAKAGGTIGLNEATWLQTPPPPELIEFLGKTIGFRGKLLTPEEWIELLERCGMKELDTRTYKSDSLSNPKEDVKDLVRALPKVVYSFLRRPLFREFLKVSVAVPKNLLDYFGYGLYVGQI